MPKYLYDEDKEETIRPLKTNTSKPKKKKPIIWLWVPMAELVGRMR